MNEPAPARRWSGALVFLRRLIKLIWRTGN